jgi:hypothetical protein
MPESKRNEQGQPIERSLTGALVTGAAAGTANAVAQQALAKLGSLCKKKPKQ